VGQPKSSRQGRGRRWPWLLAVVVLVVAVAAALQQLGWVDHWRGEDAAFPPPPLPIVVHPAAATSPITVATGRAAPAKVRRALAAPLHADGLGSHVVAEVAGLTGGPVLTRGHGAVTPASTLKILTTTAALQVLGPGWQGTTTATLEGSTVTVVGHGDVLLTRAQLTALADRAATALKAKGLTRVALRSGPAYPGPTTSPRWPASYVPEEVVTPIVPLWIDEGHTPGPDGRLGTEDDGRVADPTQQALAAFAAALRRDGVTAHLVAAGPAGATTLATHTAEPLEQVVEHILQVSDNEGAETLGHLLGGSFSGGVQATERALRGLGIPTAGLRLFDASGLSRDDRVPVPTLVAALQKAAADPRPAGVVEGLPVAGWTGSLAGRYTGSAAAAGGVVRAKTGTLTGVSNLAGLVQSADGVPLVVVIAADRITDTLAARDALDDAMAALARATLR